MKHPLEALARDSLLRLWIDAQGIIETPVSFDLLCGASAIGALFKRDAWFDQVRWEVFPTLPVMLVGGSGVGKNTAMNQIEELLLEVDRVPIIGGRTIETITDRLAKLGDPAAAVMFAKELSELVGKKDYQGGIIQGLTDLIDCSRYKDITIKSDNHNRRIMRPTLTVIAGSTADWLHKAMPAEAMAGGFWPRFALICETSTKRQVPSVKHLPEAEVIFAQQSKEKFMLGISMMLDKLGKPGEITFEPAAYKIYDEWYRIRYSFFSRTASDYAHRSRDTFIKLAMISALSRSSTTMSVVDSRFAASMIEYIASRIDLALAPPTAEALVARGILKLLPSKRSDVLYELAKVYPPRTIKDAWAMLEESQRILYEDGVWKTGLNI